MRRPAAVAVAMVVALAALLGAAGTAAAQKNRWGEVHDRDLVPEATPPAIILLTIGRGEVIFEKFGHTALCLDYHDPQRGSVCFNYGVTEFGDSGLVWNFIRGKQKFWVEPVWLDAMMSFYVRGEDRTVWSQVLPLPPAQARAVEAKLLDDIKEANRYYYYDHFADNCTTRLRDIIDEATDGKLRAGADAKFPSTFRQMGRRGLAELPPLIAFADFAVGRALDVHPTLYQAMFHPYVLMDEVHKRFEVEPKLLYERQGPAIPDDGPTGRPWALLIGLLFAAPLVAAKLLGRGERAAVAIVTVPLFLLGTIIWTAAILSTIPGLRWNEAVFLYVPFDVVLPFLGAARRRQYARVRLGMVVLVSLLRAVGLFLQPLWVPIVIAFVIFGLMALDVRKLVSRPQATA